LKRLRRLRPTLLVAGLLLTSTLLAVPAWAKKTKLVERVAMPGGVVRLDYNTCLAFSPSVHAGQFFKDLVKIERKGATEFRRGSQIIRTFPETVSLEIDVWANPCDSSSIAGSSAPPSAEVFEELKFQLEWDLSGDRMPVKVIETKIANEPWTELTQHWHYTLRVESDGIPLDSGLMIKGTSTGLIVEFRSGLTAIEHTNDETSKCVALGSFLSCPPYKKKK